MYVNNNQSSANEKQTPEERFISVLAWILSNWRTIPRYGMESSKPYNPIQGEIFRAYWQHGTGNDENDRSYFLAEQVSHHPPVSAFQMENTERQFAYRGWVYPKTTFSWNSVTTIMDGEFYVDLKKHDETYTVRHPPVSCSGVIWGTKVIEIYDKLEIVCEKTGLQATINFYCSANNSLDGSVFYTDSTERLYTVAGHVNQAVNVTKVSTGEKQELYNAKTLLRPKKTIKPVIEQEWNESRRNWHRVSYHLQRVEFDQAEAKKHLVEERQRAFRRVNHHHDEPKYFQKHGDQSWVFKLDSVKETSL
jgi:hypothetical protein